MYRLYLLIPHTFQAKNSSDSAEDGNENALVDTIFSLAYGALLLLSHTRLRLIRGRRYGICASNGSGKSTLLRAIRDGKVGEASICPNATSLTFGIPGILG